MCSYILIFQLWYIFSFSNIDSFNVNLSAFSLNSFSFCSLRCRAMKLMRYWINFTQMSLSMISYKAFGSLPKVAMSRMKSGMLKFENIQYHSFWRVSNQEEWCFYLYVYMDECAILFKITLKIRAELQVRNKTNMSRIDNLNRGCNLSTTCVKKF